MQSPHHLLLPFFTFEIFFLPHCFISCITPSHPSISLSSAQPSIYMYLRHPSSRGVASSVPSENGDVTCEGSWNRISEPSGGNLYGNKIKLRALLRKTERSQRPLAEIISDVAKGQGRNPT